MAIDIVCPGCHKRFQVSDKFAGQKGPCPSCKTEIQIPEAGDAVVVHTPEEAGPKDTAGRSVLKPIARTEANVTTTGILIVAGACITSLLGAIVLRGNAGVPILAFGALVLGPPLSAAGYMFLRDDELEAYNGLALWGRAAICGVVYAVLWGVYAWVPPLLYIEEREMIHMLIIVPPIMAGGAVAPLAAFDLDYGMAVLHYGLYLLVTIVLCLIMQVNVFFLPTDDKPEPDEPVTSASVRMLDEASLPGRLLPRLS